MTKNSAIPSSQLDAPLNLVDHTKYQESDSGIVRRYCLASGPDSLILIESLATAQACKNCELKAKLCKTERDLKS